MTAIREWMAVDEHLIVALKSNCVERCTLIVQYNWIIATRHYFHFPSFDFFFSIVHTFPLSFSLFTHISDIIFHFVFFFLHCQTGDKVRTVFRVHAKCDSVDGMNLWSTRFMDYDICVAVSHCCVHPIHIFHSFRTRQIWLILAVVCN